MLKICVDHVTSNLPITVEIAKGQEQYRTLPANSQHGLVSFAFEVSEEDLVKIAAEGRIYISLMTFGEKLQPINVDVSAKEFEKSHRISLRRVKGLVDPLILQDEDGVIWGRADNFDDVEEYMQFIKDWYIEDPEDSIDSYLRPATGDELDEIDEESWWFTCQKEHPSSVKFFQTCEKE